MTDAINQTHYTQATSGIAGGTGGASIQLVFAQLQMELAASNKESAMDRIDAIKEQQAESKRITEVINSLRNLKSGIAAADDDEIDTSHFGSFDSNMSAQARAEEISKLEGFLSEGTKLQQQASAGDADSNSAQGKANKAASGESESTMMTVEMENYFKSKGMYYDDSGVSRRQNPGEWEEALNSMRGRLAVLQAQETCDKYGIDLPTSGKLTTERLDTIIASLQAVQDETGSDIQQQMVLIQDAMGQYNSYTQGASSAISAAAETTKAVARGG